jgi:predicted O-methyltransferase YrrM
MDESGYQFSNDWHKFNQRVWEKLIPQLDPAHIVEIGSYEGQSTCDLVRRCSRNHPLLIHCIDTWEGGVEHVRDEMGAVEERFDRNLALACQSAAHPVTLVKHKQVSSLALAGLIAAQGKPADLVYVDGSHQAPDVLADAVLAFQLLRVGGLMIFDDYLWSTGAKGKEDPLNMPKLAIDSFLNIHQRKMRVLLDIPLRQIFAVKIAN